MLIRLVSAIAEGDSTKQQSDQERRSYQAARSRPAFGRGSGATSLVANSGSDDLHRLGLTVLAATELVAQLLADCRPITVTRKSADVDKQLRSTMSRRDKSEAAVIVLGAQCSSDRHLGGLTPEPMDQQVRFERRVRRLLHLAAIHVCRSASLGRADRRHRSAAWAGMRRSNLGAPIPGQKRERTQRHQNSRDTTGRLRRAVVQLVNCGNHCRHWNSLRTD